MAFSAPSLIESPTHIVDLSVSAPSDKSNGRHRAADPRSAGQCEINKASKVRVKMPATAMSSPSFQRSIELASRINELNPDWKTDAPPLSRDANEKIAQTFTLAQQATGRWAVNSVGDLHFWNGSYWEAVDDVKLTLDAWRWLTVFFGNEANDAMARQCAATLHHSPYLLPDQDAQRIVVACEDFYLEAAADHGSTRWVRIAPDPKLGFTSCVPIKLDGRIGEEYKPLSISDAPLISEYLRVSLGDVGVRAVVQDYVGYTMVPPSALNLGVALVMIGGGGDGKGLLSSLTTRILHRHSTMAFDIGSKDGFSLEGIEGGISLATVDELPINEAIQSKDIKSAVTGDPMSINRKGRKRITARPKARFMICGNDLPRFDHGGAAALGRRFLFVPFSARLSVKERIANLEDMIIAKEAKAFFDWALAGATRVVNRRGFDYDNLPDICRKMNGEAVEASDATLGFMREFGVEFSVESPMKKDEVYQDYLAWTENQGMKPLAQPSFYKRLISHLNVGSIEAPRGRGEGRPRCVYLAYDKFADDSVAPLPITGDEKPPFDD